MGATDFTEMPGFPTETLNTETGDYSAVRQFQCDWADRYLVRDYLFNHANRGYEYDSNLWATQCELSPVGDRVLSAGTGYRVNYEKAVLKVTYELVTGSAKDPTDDTDNPNGMDFAEESVDSDMQVVNLSGGELYWTNPITSTGRLVGDLQVPAVQIPFTTYSVTFHNMSAIPSGVYDLLGSVNESSYLFRVLNKTAAAETLLFESISGQRSLTYSGTAGWTFTFTFKYNPNTWNKFYDPDDQIWAYIYDYGGTQIEPYTPEDWSAIAIPPDPS